MLKLHENKTPTAHMAGEVQFALICVFPFTIPEHGMPSIWLIYIISLRD